MYLIDHIGSKSSHQLLVVLDIDTYTHSPLQGKPHSEQLHLPSLKFRHQKGDIISSTYNLSTNTYFSIDLLFIPITNTLDVTSLKFTSNIHDHSANKTLIRSE